MVSWEVPLVEIEVPDEDVEAVLDCLRSGWLTMGPRTKAFEEEFARHVGTSHAVAVSSGTAALHLACLAESIGPGDEVIVPSFTFAATAHAPRYCGADVVLCDAHSVTDPMISPATVEPLIGPKTKAMIAVHMWGYTADAVGLWELCKQRGIAMITDIAQAAGAVLPDGRRVGSVTDLGCFSFFSKTQLAVGEGGALTTKDDQLADRLRRLRSHAMTSLTWERHHGYVLGYDVTEIGFNYRLDEPRAALALSRLGRLDEEIDGRRRVARAYRERLAGVDGIEILFDDAAVERGSHFVFPILAESGEARDAIRERLQERGVQTTWYPALHRLTEYGELGDDGSLPHSSEVADRHICLPIFASLDEGRIDLVCERLREAVEVRLLQ